MAKDLKSTNVWRTTLVYGLLGFTEEPLTYNSELLFYLFIYISFFETILVFIANDFLYIVNSNYTTLPRSNKIWMTYSVIAP